MKSSEAWYRKQRIWRHNSFFGFIRMMEVQAYSIENASTTTPEAKEIARAIQGCVKQLRLALQTRIDN